MSSSDVASIYSDVTSLASRGNADGDDDDGDSLLSVQEAVDDGRSGLSNGQEQHKTLEQALKALEAGADAEDEDEQEEAENEATSSPPTTPRPASSRDGYGTGVWRPGLLEQTPLLDAGPAPPDYAQAIGYSTFSAQPHQHVNVYRRRGHGDERNSLAALEDDEVGDASPKKLHNYVRRNWRHMCLFNLAIYSLVVTIALALKHFANERMPEMMINAVKYPDHVRSWGFGGDGPGSLDQVQFHRSTSECSFNSYLQQGFSQGFRMTNFTFVEAIDPSPNSDISDIQVSGNIDVRPAPYDQSEPVMVWISLATTSPWEVVRPVGDYLDDGFVMRFPELERTDGHDVAHAPSQSRAGKRACLDFYIGIYVRQSLDSWHMSSTHGNINIGYPPSFDPELNWRFYVLNDIRISTTKGNISADYVTSRVVELQATQGSIKGNYSFDDSMSVTTTSGEIDVLINQSARRRPRTNPSKLESSTVSGDIRLSLHHEELPEDWIPRMEQYNLESHHHSHSGTISLNYTGYQGAMTAATEDGSIDIHGTELESCTADPGGRLSEGAAKKCVTRGSLNSTSLVESVSGDIEASLGDHLVYWPAVTV